MPNGVVANLFNLLHFAISFFLLWDLFGVVRSRAEPNTIFLVINLLVLRNQTIIVLIRKAQKLRLLIIKGFLGLLNYWIDVMNIEVFVRLVFNNPFLFGVLYQEVNIQIAHAWQLDALLDKASLSQMKGYVSNMLVLHKL